jgi:mycothiol synthase
MPGWRSTPGPSPITRTRVAGQALTLAGLRHLCELGLDQVMLYADESNARAIKLYQRLGFARWSTDVCFVGPTPPAKPHLS